MCVLDVLVPAKDLLTWEKEIRNIATGQSDTSPLDSSQLLYRLMPNGTEWLRVATDCCIADWLDRLLETLQHEIEGLELFYDDK